MMEPERLVRLRALVAEIERLPRTNSRDTLLAEIRKRIVHIETGEAGTTGWRHAPSAEQATQAALAAHFSARSPRRRLV